MSRRLVALAALASTALSALAGTAPAQASPTYSQVSLSAVVDGSSVTATAVVKARRATTVRRYGICVRDAAGKHHDFPGKRSDVRLGRKGTSLTATATFEPGQYTYYPCVQNSRRAWVRVGVSTFTVPSASSEPSTEPSTGPSTASGAGTSLAWSAPTLTSPVTIDVTQSKHSLKLDPTRDYVLRLPSTGLDVGAGNLSINGGRRVVLVGGQITGSGERGTIRATNQSEYLHIEGLHITGAHLQEGIQLQNEDNAVVQLENVRIDRVSGSYSGHHADLVQTWGGGPKALRIDRLTGTTDYQAFMLQGGAPTSGWDFRHVNISHVGSAGWTMFDASPRSSAIAFDDVWFTGNDRNGVYSLGHGGGKAGLTFGTPPGGDFAATAGLDYHR